jgi:hypothetical protein
MDLLAGRGGRVGLSDRSRELLLGGGRRLAVPAACVAPWSPDAPSLTRLDGEYGVEALVDELFRDVRVDREDAHPLASTERERLAHDPIRDHGHQFRRVGRLAILENE